MEEEHIILHAPEIEAYLESLQLFDIPNIGSPRWFNQQEKIYNLSLQAALDVKSGREEIIKENIITLHKVPLLVHELIATELWRLKIFPLLTKSQTVMKSNVPIYIVLYHEVTLVSFLEAVLFHEDVFETAADVLIDLIDYCYRKIIKLSSLENESHADSRSAEEANVLYEQKKDLDFESGMKCISLLSYMTQHLKILPLSALHRLLVTHDIPLLFTNLIDDPPWVRTVNEEKEKYYEGKWTKCNQEDLMKLNKAEGQVWIALIQLLLNPECQKKYDMTGYKKDQLLKLRSKLNDVIFDQIPILNELLRFLEYLSMFEAPIPKTGIIIEQVPDIWETLQNKYEGKWNRIAQGQMEDYFSLSDAELQKFCKKLSGSFDLTNIEAALPDTPICATCGGIGLKRCSRCKNEWYCGRSCQVSHWLKHKTGCDLMACETENT
ncbi:zinc finger MYND domain-containing protein 10 [Parasteatoda tepidariorum]|uniref:zinc finger MYND domain-containing protein 10 n=1 Tax=Parasteatoda tepidariorum TaxID=114398 RepID=UPI0039BD2694